MSAPRPADLARLERRQTIFEEQLAELRSELRDVVRAVASLNRQTGEVRSLLLDIAKRRPPDGEEADG